MPDERVLDGARRALERHGPAGATLERIAAEAGLSRVTLHRRGVTREAILGALAQAAAEAYRRALWPALTGAGAGAERLRDALAAICAVAEEHLAVLVALRAQADAVFHADDDGDGEVATRDVFTEPLERLLRDGAADGTLRADLDPAETATVLFNQVGWTYVHLRTGHRWPPERAAGAVVELALAACKGQSRCSGSPKAGKSSG